MRQGDAWFAIALCSIASTGIACSTPQPGETPILGLLERQRIELTAEVREPLVELAVAAGDSVAQGAVVARLDDARAVASASAAEARVRRVEARIAELARGGRSEVLDQTRARLAENQATLAQAEIDVTRAAHLLRDGVSSQADLDQAELALETASARLNQDRARLAELLAGATSEEMSQARADYEIAQAELASARIDVERHVLRAPVDGRIDAVVYRLGERPETGVPVVVLLADGAPYARVHVPESIRARVVPGTEAKIFVDGFDRPLPGVVRFVASEATFTPYYALSEHDRHRLSFAAEVAIQVPAGDSGASTVDLPSGLPVRVLFDWGP